MVCRTCGTINNEGTDICINCGTTLAIDPEAELMTRIVRPEEKIQCEEKITDEKRKENKKYKLNVAMWCALISVSVALSGTVIGLAASDSIKKKYSQILKPYTSDPIVAVAADDFDKNGTVEAYAVTGTEEKDGFKDADIWYIDENSDVRLVNHNVSGKYNGVVDGKGVSFELNDKDNKTKEEILEPELSSKIEVKKAENKVTQTKTEKVVEKTQHAKEEDRISTDSVDSSDVIVDDHTDYYENTTIVHDHDYDYDYDYDDDDDYWSDFDWDSWDYEESSSEYYYYESDLDYDELIRFLDDLCETDY